LNGKFVDEFHFNTAILEGLFFESASDQPPAFFCC